MPIPPGQRTNTWTDSILANLLVHHFLLVQAVRNTPANSYLVHERRIPQWVPRHHFVRS